MADSTWNLRDWLKKLDQEDTPFLCQAFRELGFREGKRTLQRLRTLRLKKPFSGQMEDLIQLALSSPNPDLALTNLERVTSPLKDGALAGIQRGSGLEALVAACGGSPALVNLLAKEPRYADWLFSQRALERKGEEGEYLRNLQEKITEGSNFEDLCAALRWFRHREILRIGMRDLVGLAGLEETMESLSDLAGACLREAYEFCLRSLVLEYGIPRQIESNGAEREGRFVIIGLGKLGGRELNFSSDIDLFYLYSSDRGETTGGNSGRCLPLPQFYTRLADLISRAIGEVTEDGWVFRVDLRLRPEGTRGNLANSLRSAEIYYESWGQTWERAAFLKARPVAGSRELGRKFLEMMRPFVYRKYLDYTTVEEFREMKRGIDRQSARQEAENPWPGELKPRGKDVKLGRGGIREIEFFVQTLQLIHGGKDSAVREGNTLKALENLREGSYIQPEECQILQESYLFLRQVEHKLQIVQARQTHRLPTDPQEIRELALRLGLRDSSDRAASDLFLDELEGHCQRVQTLYGQLFYQPGEEIGHQVNWEISDLLREDLPEGELLSHLHAYGFRDPKAALRHLILLREGPPYVHFPPKGQRLLKKIAPLLLTEIVSSSDPDAALSNLEGFLSIVGARTTFLSLLAENPPVIRLLIRLFEGSDYLAGLFRRSPELLDTLVRSDQARPRRNRAELCDGLRQLVSAAGTNYEEALDALRQFRNAELLRIGMNDLYRVLNHSQRATQITRLADICLQQAYEIARTEMKRKYGRPFRRDSQGKPHEAQFAVIGLGKFGGEEMGYNSDLDVIFVYSHAGECQGGKSLSNHEYFVKLAQQIITVLSCPTRYGYAFKVDTRLRPSGNAGPLVSSFNSLRDYHRAHAQVWERQTLLKARFVAGNPALGARVLRLIRLAAYREALSEEDAREIYRLRMRMEHELAQEAPGTFDLKMGRGGLVDIQFVVQLLQMRHGYQCRRIRDRNTLQALEKLFREGLLPSEEHEQLVAAWNFLEDLSSKLRIARDRSLNELIDEPETWEALARKLSAGNPAAPLSGKELHQKYLEHTDTVRRTYLRHFSPGNLD